MFFSKCLESFQVSRQWFKLVIFIENPKYYF